MIDGNDGGMNITKDGGDSWRFIGNLPVAQFYHINIDNEFGVLSSFNVSKLKFLM